MTHIQIYCGHNLTINTLLLPPFFFHPIEQRPNLCQLISFRVRSGNINLLEQIGTNYWKLGVQLLNDATGAVTKAIVEQYQNDAAKINMENTPAMDPGWWEIAC